METKKPIESRILWFNVLSIAAIIITEILAKPEMVAVLGGYTSILMVSGAVINAILRLDTSTAIKTKPKQPPNDHPQTSESIIAEELKIEERDRGLY